MTKLHKNNARGIQLILVGCIILPMMDAAAKFVGEDVPSSIIVLSRFGFQSVFLLPLVWKNLYMPKGSELVLHLARSFSLVIATLCFFTAIQVMPIVDSLAIFFTMPLIVNILAPIILGEKVSWQRLVAALVGMVGSVFIIQPGKELFGFHIFLPFVSAVTFSFYLMITRKLSSSNKWRPVPAITMQFFCGVFGTIIVLATIILFQPFSHPVFTLMWPEKWQWGVLILVGFLAAISHLVITSAFKYAEASILAPFQYAELIVATILGWLIFGDFPVLSTWIGTFILVASGLYVFYRERNR